MTLSEKKKKAVMVAVACFLEQEAAEGNRPSSRSMWSRVGKETMMQNRVRVQRRGRDFPVR